MLLALPDLLAARQACQLWRRSLTGAVLRLPHASDYVNMSDYDHGGCSPDDEAFWGQGVARQLVELDVQPSQQQPRWQRRLDCLAACLPRLAEVMGEPDLRSDSALVPASSAVGLAHTRRRLQHRAIQSLPSPRRHARPSLGTTVYCGSRPSHHDVAAQLVSLPAALPGLTKLELRHLQPSEPPPWPLAAAAGVAPDEPTSFRPATFRPASDQLPTSQPGRLPSALSHLTPLRALYLIQASHSARMGLTGPFASEPRIIADCMLHSVRRAGPFLSRPREIPAHPRPSPTPPHRAMRRAPPSCQRPCLR